MTAEGYLSTHLPAATARDANRGPACRREPPRSALGARVSATEAP